MTEAETTLIALLKKHRINITKPRLLVFQSLLNKEPQRFNQIFTLLNGKIDRASIYRSLKLFNLLGITKHIQNQGKVYIELSEKFRAHHHHLSCNRCGDITAIHEKSIEKIIDVITHQYAFSSSDHQLEIQGICHKCQERA
ncbi:MAG: Fur family transcriptional regulator [Candidatus Saccharimonadales bacterium]